MSGAWSCKTGFEVCFAVEPFIMAGGWLVFDNAQVLFQGGAVARPGRQAKRAASGRKRRRVAPR